MCAYRYRSLSPRLNTDLGISIFLFFQSIYLIFGSRLILPPIIGLLGSLIFFSAYTLRDGLRQNAWLSIGLPATLIATFLGQWIFGQGQSVFLFLSFLAPMLIAIAARFRRTALFVPIYLALFALLLFLPKGKWWIDDTPAQYRIYTLVAQLFGWLLVEWVARGKAGNPEHAAYLAHHDDEALRNRQELLGQVSRRLRTTMGNISVAAQALVEGDHITSERRRALLLVLRRAEEELKTFVESIYFESMDSQPDATLSHFMLNDYLTVLVNSELKALDLHNAVRFTFDPTLPQQVRGDSAFLERAVSHVLCEVLHPNLQKGLPLSVSSLQVGTSADPIVQVHLEFTCGDAVGMLPQPLSPLDADPHRVNLRRSLRVQRGQHGVSASFIIPIERNELNRRGFTGPVILDTSTPPPSGQPLDNALLKGIHVLMAEDNAINRKVMELALMPHVQSIDFVVNGEEAVKRFNENHYDLILMDIQMPVLDGLEATRRIRAAEKTRGGHVPIIALTAYALLGDRERCLQAGMDSYLSKPFENETLLGLMCELLSR